MIDSTTHSRTRHPLLQGRHGVYAITPQTEDTPALLSLCQQALAAGVELLQYRSKNQTAARQHDEASALAELCRQHQVPLIINDNIDLCLAVAADGVHLGRDDGDIKEARARLGADKIIGVSCYNEWARAQAGQAAGADYLAFGACFPSATKPSAVQCPPALLQQARSLGLPVVAIGGITAENGASLVHAGADLLAVISDLFQAKDIARRMAQYRALFAASDV